MNSGAGEKRTGYLELFFDLVFVFAVTQLVTILHTGHGTEAWLHVALLAWLVWWAWSQFTWAGNAIDLDRRPTRVALLAVTGVTLLFAAALPQAFTPGGALRFAVPYVAVRFGGLALYWAGLRDDPAHRAALRTYLPVAVVPPVVVLAGALAPADPRAWFWLAAAALDVGSAIAGGRGEFRVGPTHFAERHALFVIIALGEAIVGVGATVAGIELTPLVLATTAAAFAIIAVQWWGYFDWVQRATEHRLAGEDDLRRRARLARDLYTFAHFPIVLGSVLFAFGVEEAVAHPSDPLGAAGLAAVGGGLVLFHAGFLAGNARAVGTLLPERAAALAVVAVAVLALGPRLPAVTLLLVLALGLVPLAALETVRRTAPAPLT